MGKLVALGKTVRGAERPSHIRSAVLARLILNECGRRLILVVRGAERPSYILNVGGALRAANLTHIN